MKKKLADALCALVICLLATVGPAFAHHGTTGYDSSKTLTLEGKVTKYVWSNPHIIVFMDAPDQNGKVEHWIIELAAPLMMQRFGWSKTLMKPGDRLVAQVHPAKNGAPVGISGTSNTLLEFTVNGKPLPHL